jgi:hypothetical protein
LPVTTVSGGTGGCKQPVPENEVREVRGEVRVGGTDWIPFGPDVDLILLWSRYRLPGTPPLGGYRRRGALLTTDKGLGFTLMVGDENFTSFALCKASKCQVSLSSFQGLGCPAGHVWRGGIDIASYKRTPRGGGL